MEILAASGPEGTQQTALPHRYNTVGLGWGGAGPCLLEQYGKEAEVILGLLWNSRPCPMPT